MRFAELFARAHGPIVSFELFPPKTDAAMESLRGVLPKLVALRPDFMTVTYGALGSTRGRTLEIASQIRREFAMETACHLTCVGSTREEIDRILDDVALTGIENLVALRGDPPAGETSFTPPPGGFRHASELVAHVRARRTFGMAVAGYPEKHVEAPDRATDLRHLRDKVAAGGDIVITQLFYDNAHYFRFVEEARTLGIRVPIVPGLLPAVSAAQVKRMTGLCGATAPAALLGRLEDAGADEARSIAVGVEHTVAQARELLERGVPGIHFYVLNRSGPVTRIMDEIRPHIAARITPLSSK